MGAALVVAWITVWGVRRLALRRRSRLLAKLYRSCRRAWTAVLVVTSLYVAIPSLMLDEQGQVRPPPARSFSRPRPAGPGRPPR
ncbi:hypothetical protein [Actinopolymorpha pittospori]